MKTFSWRAAGTVPLVLLAIVSIATTAQAAEKKTLRDGYVAALRRACLARGVAEISSSYDVPTGT